MSSLDTLLQFKQWLKSNGGKGFHSDLDLVQRPTGLSVFATGFLPPESKLVECSTSLAITAQLASSALKDLLGSATDALSTWSERQLQATYLSLHWIVKPSGHSPPPPQLAHLPYVSVLPHSTTLSTSLYFTPDELEAFKGTNLYGATLDRKAKWEAEWRTCRDLVTSSKPEWGALFSWDFYMHACTALSSRAFPSNLLPHLSSEPVHPVLLPGLDSFNHSRSSNVSWVFSESDSPLMSIVQHKVAVKGQEVFIDYGPKPNSELILGYGFAIPENPDDTILLKIGGGPSSGTRWEIGRDAKGAEGLFQELLQFVAEEPEGDISYEDYLQASDTLKRMVDASVSKLPKGDTPNVRAEILAMRDSYVEGQRGIFLSLLAFAKRKERDAIEAAQAEGIELVFEEEETI